MAALNGTENEKAFISEELYEKLSAVSGKLEKGDVLVTGGGSVGKPYIVPNNEPLYTKDADLLWIKNNENLDPYFVYTFFFSPTFTDYLNSVSHVGTIAHYTITQLGETPITLPCVSEQQKIRCFGTCVQWLRTLLRLGVSAYTDCGVRSLLFLSSPFFSGFKGCPSCKRCIGTFNFSEIVMRRYRACWV